MIEKNNANETNKIQYTNGRHSKAKIWKKS